MKLINYILVFALLIVFIPAVARGSKMLPDSLTTLSAKQFVEILKQYHPVAKQADIFVEKSKADVTIARGMFDPVLANETAAKSFDGTNYYYYNRPELVIPTWFGVEVSAGLEYLSGNRTDPEETKGTSNYLGISVPLAKNLLMDKRRATLKTAKIFREASSQEKRNILNNLMLDALKTYWTWVQQYQVHKTICDAVAVNEKRVELVKTAYRLGDRPAIDTAEALVQLQNFELQRNQAWLDFQNTTWELSVFLWTPESGPYNLSANIIPTEDLQTLSIADAVLPDLNNLLTVIKNHPELMIYRYKINALEVDKKLKFQELLPTVNFRYNQLGKENDILKTASTGPLFQNNFQYGLSLSIPLRLSQGRGDYRKAKLKITEMQLQQVQKQQQVENKVRSYFNELMAVKNQVVLQEKAYRNYQVLQRGEEIRFMAGESSLFLINARENKTLEALQKLQELKAKYFKVENMLRWAAGIMIL